jgi:hypothetical protein
MSGDHRVFLKWDNESFIVLTDPDLTDLVERFGPPTTVEFRAQDEGYVTITHANWDDDDPDDIRGQLDRLVDKGDMTRAAADDYLTHYRED